MTSVFNRYRQLIPDEYGVRVPQLYGEAGATWLANLPTLLEQIARRFDVKFGEPLSNLSWNLLISAVTVEGRSAIVKIGPNQSELTRETTVLRAWHDKGAARVLDHAPDLSALLLERTVPGTALAQELDDVQATEIFCRVFTQLHGRNSSSTDNVSSARLGRDSRMCALPEVPTMIEHFAAVDRYLEGASGADVQGPLPRWWVERGRQALASLLETTCENRLLHGDLHHENILKRDEGEWVVIDPKGLLGDPHFEPIQFLLNYVDRGGSPDEVLSRRLSIISKRLGLHRQRVALWGVARGILEACWGLEDAFGPVGWEPGIAISERFARVYDDE